MRKAGDKGKGGWVEKSETNIAGRGWPGISRLDR